MTKADCERMKRNFGLCLLQNTGNVAGANMETFTIRMKAVLEHAFNNHEFCGKEWFKHLTKNDTELDDVDTKSRFMDRHIGETYSKLKKMHDKHTTETKLKQCFHGFSSQKNETMIKKMSVTAPKDQTFSGTVLLTSCTHLVCIQDSLGELEAVSRIMSAMGFVGLHPTFCEFLVRSNNTGKYHHRRRLMTKIKIKRNLDKVTKLRESIQKEAANKKNGFGYKKDLALHVDMDNDGCHPNKKKRYNAKAKTATAGPKKACKCGGTDHSRVTYCLCPLYQPKIAVVTAPLI